MSGVSCRRYRGPLKAAVLDWAGTVVDFGCQAPAATFVEAFAAEGIAISVAQARAPMGMAKRDHIKAITAMADVASAWQARHGRAIGEADIDRLYDAFLPLQLAAVRRHAQLIPGALEAVESMRAQGFAIGTTTGYPRAVMAVVAAEAEAQGYRPDCVIAAEDAPLGRPSPFPALAALARLGVYPVEAVVKIGDTVVDIEEGLNGGMWSVGITVTGNEVGLTEAEWQVLDERSRAHRREEAAEKLRSAGAHYVVDSLGDAVRVLDAINRRLARGDKP
ncbi:MAG TPA: phosphonoacetaldehyde hydrolase [Defluviicoccus sp.]|nr:phosphonoacetaldehyde hydrolase [Defluviicoccus sp.]